MNLLLTSHPVTPEDLLRMPDGNRFELVNGRLAEVPVSALSSFIAGVHVGRVAAEGGSREAALAEALEAALAMLPPESGSTG